MGQELKFEDALLIAQGLLEAGGGYRGDARMFLAYKDGVRAVLTALKQADRHGFQDANVKALHSLGYEIAARQADIAYNDLKNSGGLNAREAARTAAEERKWGEQ